MNQIPEVLIESSVELVITILYIKEKISQDSLILLSNLHKLDMSCSKIIHIKILGIAHQNY